MYFDNLPSGVYVGCLPGAQMLSRVFKDNLNVNHAAFLNSEAITLSANSGIIYKECL